MLRFVLACFVLMALPASGESTGRPTAPVKASQAGDILVLDNGLVEVRFDIAKRAFTATARGVPFVRRGRLSDTRGQARLIGVGGPLGTGKAIAFESEDGRADLLMLYPGLPFVCVKARIHNPTKKPIVIDKITPTTVTVDLGKAAKDLRALGCDGLTPADKPRTSYMFLAVGDPASRAGVVAGWLTHERGSGIVLSKPDQARVHIEARAEYGKLRIPPGKTAEGETFAVGRFDDALAGLETYADTIAKANRIRLRPIPCGYCTWYSAPHGGASDEKAMAQLADFCREHLMKFGFRVLQIDDKWQISNRDFTTHHPRGPYRHGMKPTADKITAAGMTAGIWITPFGWDHKRPVFKDHQDWFVKRADGKPYEVYWAGTCLDMTHPGARRFLREAIARMAREWGYKYIKTDGLWAGMAVKILYPEPNYRDDRLGDAVFHDPAKTNVEAYRDGLALVRDAAGDDVYLLGCNIAQNMRTLGASIGRVDGMRVGRDIGASWEHILPSAIIATHLYFLHGRVWHNDPDCLMVRKPMTVEQARAWGSWIALTGQLNLVSEWLPKLPADRLDIVKRSMPNHGLCGRPVDLFENAFPQIWHLTAGQGRARRDVIGLFNWDAKAADSLRVELARLDLPDSGKGTYVGFDYWANKFVPPFTGTLTADVPPSSCRIVAIRPVQDRPQLISTSRHVTQGVIDVLAETWDAAGGVLSGASLVVADDPYELRIVAPTQPKSWQAVAARVLTADKAAGVTAVLEQSGPRVRVTLTSKTSRKVHWEVTCKQGPGRTPQTREVTGVSAKAARFGAQVVLAWDASEAASYRVTRNDGRTATVAVNRFVDTNVEAGTTYAYMVRAIGWTGRPTQGASVQVTVPKLDVPPAPPKPNVHLSELKPVRATVGWGKLGVNKTVQDGPLTVNDKKYDKGMGVHAHSELVYACKADYKRFVAVVGLDFEMRKDDRPSVVFKVYADKTLLADSPVLTWKTVSHWHFDVPIPARSRQIRLIVTDADDGIAADHADWVDAGFVVKP